MNGQETMSFPIFKDMLSASKHPIPGEERRSPNALFNFWITSSGMPAIIANWLGVWDSVEVMILRSVSVLWMGNETAAATLSLEGLRTRSRSAQAIEA